MQKRSSSAGAAQSIGSLVSRLMSRRGYAQVRAVEALQEVFAAEVGELLAQSSRVGKITRGTLHIYVADSVSHQELVFRKRSLLARFQQELPTGGIRDIRFHISGSAS